MNSREKKKRNELINTKDADEYMQINASMNLDKNFAFLSLSFVCVTTKSV